MNQRAVRTDLPVITLNVYGLNLQSKDRKWLNGFKKKRDVLPTSDVRIYRLKVRRGKDIPYKWKSKESWGSYT